ncbi:MAG: lipid IV(A) 3-deoxy-D-manno-octulosonic acid transferase [Rhizobiaceae bacterium]|nr:lipid IV(A) 3-deoxy-D-manno-octulosonic acid transferase [Rhizobiaceae bacterium]
MSERWARAVLSTYRWAGAASFPFVGGYVAWRASRGMEDNARRHERYGRATAQRPAGPLIWVHAANDAETLAIVPLVSRLRALGIGVVLTTGSVTSADIVGERLNGSVIHQYVPLDLKPAIARFLDHWQPDLAIFAESEIWPMTVLELAARRVPQVLVNGRMSDRAFASWRRRSSLAEALFERFAKVVAQGDTDAERFVALGARPVTVSGNLKTDVASPPVDELELKRVRNDIGERPRWSALWTSAGEEKVAGEVHRLLMNRHPDVMTIVMPRDPRRADQIEAELTGMGLNVVRRSRKDRITPKSHILIGDTARETGLYLRLADIAFLGGSLAGGGGQNPLEAAMLKVAILSGQNIAYHSDLYAPLIANGGVRLLRDGEMLAGAVNFLLRNDKARRDIGAAGAAAVETMRGALDHTVRELGPFVQPLVVKARLQDDAGRRR